MKFSFMQIVQIVITDELLFLAFTTSIVDTNAWAQKDSNICWPWLAPNFQEDY